MGILLLWILAAALVAYSLMLVFLSNFNMGNLMVWVLTAVITVCAIWHKPLDHKMSSSSCHHDCPKS